MIIFLLIGGSFIAYRQLIVIPKQEAKSKLQTLPVKRDDLKIIVSANGTVQSQMSVNISPETAGILKSLKVKEGDRVLNHQGITVVLVTHELGVAEKAKITIRVQDGLVVV